MREVLRKHGLLGCMSASPPTCTEKYGVAERSNRTIQEGVRTRLVQAKLGLSYWWLALTDTIEVDMHVPLKGSTSETPYSRFFGAMPSIAHVRSFGCLAYPHLDNEAIEMAERAPRGIYLGRHPDQSAYRVLEISTGKIITTPHAMFIEEDFPRAWTGCRTGRDHQHRPRPAQDGPTHDAAQHRDLIRAKRGPLATPMPAADRMPEVPPAVWRQPALPPAAEDDSDLEVKAEVGRVHHCRRD